ncbi:hypothetical protein BHY_1227 (plasmid) [Borrelia nietonii YOR]|uniref:Uncharacterized protein n=2 Tax=Borrelia TaxID=138 RepID=W5SBU1_9SPIR|nr:hypothetical protein BHY_1227 [Borrelia nietonii YOR]AHH14453.1 hypothetical protein BHW_0900013 [Borrelia hermsii MTW]
MVKIFLVYLFYPILYKYLKIYPTYILFLILVAISFAMIYIILQNLIPFSLLTRG